MGLANSLALKLARITRETKDPPGGAISRTSDGGKVHFHVDASLSRKGLVYGGKSENM